MRGCDDCPIRNCIAELFPPEGREAAWRAAALLTARFSAALQNTEGISTKEIRKHQKEVIRSMEPSTERTLIQNNPDLTAAVYACEMKIQLLKNCVLFPVKK